MTPDDTPDDFTPDDTRDRLNRSALRITAGDPGRMGHWLHRHRETESLSTSDLAAKLGTDDSGLSRLALCVTPHPDTFAADVTAIAAHCGADPAAVANLLRQEQAVAAWSGASQVAPNEAGWLLAAHDADQPPPGDDDDDPRPN